MAKHRLREYLAMVGNSWGAAISGPALAIFGLILLIVQSSMDDGPGLKKAVKVISWATLGAAVLLIPKAQYDVWKSERESREKAETELTSDALIRGNVIITPLNYNPFQGGGIGSGFHYGLECANHGRQPCQISKVVIQISGAAIPTPIEQIHTVKDTALKTIERGERYKLKAQAFIRGIKLSQLSRCEIAMRVVDSLGNEYPITVERRPFSPRGGPSEVETL